MLLLLLLLLLLQANPQTSWPRGDDGQAKWSAEVSEATVEASWRIRRKESGVQGTLGTRTYNRDGVAQQTVHQVTEHSIACYIAQHVTQHSMLHSTAQHLTQHSTARYTAQHSTAPYTAQHVTQHSTLHSTARHVTT